MPRPRKPPAVPETALHELGLEIRHWREQRGLTISELATLVGKDRRTILGAEDGRDRPSEATVNLIERQLSSGGLIAARYEAVLAERRQWRLERGIHFTPAPDARDDDASSFLDETIADGTMMEPGHRFEKTWTIRNVGTVTWENRFLVRIGMSAGPGLITTPERVAVTATAPGETFTARVSCVAPYEEGISRANFKMADDEGRLFFPDRYTVGLQMQVIVRPERKRTTAADRE